jgi:GDP-D-mannose dehydratase
VYGRVTEEDIPIKETQKFNPMSPYAVSKAGADLMSIAYFHNFGIKVIVTRAFTHTGPRRGEVFVTSAFAKQIAEIEVGLKKKPIVHVGNLDSVRTFLDVRDIVKAYYLAIRRCIPGEAYNIGGNFTMTIKEMLERLIDMSTMKSQIEVKVSNPLLRSADVTLQIPSVEKFKKATGWEPMINIQDTLHDTLEYWRRQVRRKYD